jgi:hypothetical protein
MTTQTRPLLLLLALSSAGVSPAPVRALPTGTDGESDLGLVQALRASVLDRLEAAGMLSAESKMTTASGDQFAQWYNFFNCYQGFWRRC